MESLGLSLFLELELDFSQHCVADHRLCLRAMLCVYTFVLPGVDELTDSTLSLHHYVTLPHQTVLKCLWSRVKKGKTTNHNNKVLEDTVHSSSMACLVYKHLQANWVKG